LRKNYSKFGTIIKRETLASASLSVPSKYLVLHSNDPYPGYYCNLDQPADNSCKDISYYIPIRELQITDEETYCRISLKMHARLGLTVCHAMFNFEGSNIHAFRVKHTDEDGLHRLLRHLEGQGLQFFNDKKVKSFLSHIHLRSFFEIRQISENIYANRDSAGLFYFAINEMLNWEDFEKIITYQKNHSSFKNFDAATGYWIEKPAFTDFVRIYGNALNVSTLESIRKDFLRDMRKYKRQGMLI